MWGGAEAGVVSDGEGWGLGVRPWRPRVVGLVGGGACLVGREARVRAKGAWHSTFLLARAPLSG